MLCSVIQHFVLIDVELGMQPAFVGTAKGRSEAWFAFGVKSGDICERPCCRGSFVSLAPTSIKLYHSKQLHCTREQTCGLQVTF